MVNVSELMTDPAFSTRYKVYRTRGEWKNGRFDLTNEECLNFRGPVQPAQPKEIETLPEGDRLKEIVKFMCAPPKKLYVTAENKESPKGESYVSDVVEYDGALYKIVKVAPWQRNGFVRAFGYRIGTVKNG